MSKEELIQLLKQLKVETVVRLDNGNLKVGCLSNRVLVEVQTSLILGDEVISSSIDHDYIDLPND